MKCRHVIAVFAAFTSFLAAPHPTAAQDPPESLRAALKAAGFAAPEGVPPSDLDRKWTSSDWSYNDTRFVAAIYFEDEMPGAMLLGPLHLIQITKAGNVDRLQLSNDDKVIKGGAITGLSVHEHYSLVDTHLSPSAGFILLLDPSLTLLETLPGFGARILADRTIVFEANMVHFADFHRQTLQQFRPSRKNTVEVYPGSLKSTVHDRATRAVRKRFEEMLFEKDAREHEIDRSIDLWRANAGVDRIALVVAYYSMRLIGPDADSPNHNVWAIARCDREADSWTCTERPLVDVARQYKITIPNSDIPAAREAAFGRLLERVLREQ